MRVTLRAKPDRYALIACEDPAPWEQRATPPLLGASYDWMTANRCPAYAIRLEQRLCYRAGALVAVIA